MRRSRPPRHRRTRTLLALALAVSAIGAPGGVRAQGDAGPPAQNVAATGVVGRTGSPHAGSAARGTLRTDTLWSPSLGTRKQFVVWLPPSYDSSPGRRYPVAYYLHGAYGGEWDWVRSGKIDQVLDSLAAGGPEMIVVMPDGDDGFYTTWNQLATYADCARRPPAREPVETYCVPWPHYDDYIARDLVARVDSSYRTIPERGRRAIAGLSMGGYGAVSLALRYPDVFGAAASHSGVLAPTYVGPHPFDGHPRWARTPGELAAAYGEALSARILAAFGRDSSAWWARDPARMAERLQAREPARLPALMIDCGTEDFLLDQNRAVHAALTRLGIAHAYAEWPGGHTWTYWHQHVRESLRWIADRFAPPLRP